MMGGREVLLAAMGTEGNNDGRVMEPMMIYEPKKVMRGQEQLKGWNDI